MVFYIKSLFVVYKRTVLVRALDEHVGNLESKTKDPNIYINGFEITVLFRNSFEIQISSERVATTHVGSYEEVQKFMTHSLSFDKIKR